MAKTSIKYNRSVARHILRSTTEKRIDLDSDLSVMLNITCHTQGSIDPLVSDSD